MAIIEASPFTLKPPLPLGGEAGGGVMQETVFAFPLT